MILPWGQTTRSRESRTQSAPPGRRAGLGTITGSNEPSQIPAGPDRSDLDEYGHWPAPRCARSYPLGRVRPARAGPVGSSWMFDRRMGRTAFDGASAGGDDICEQSSMYSGR